MYKYEDRENGKCRHLFVGPTRVAAVGASICGQTFALVAQCSLLAL